MHALALARKVDMLQLDVGRLVCCASTHVACVLIPVLDLWRAHCGMMLCAARAFCIRLTDIPMVLFAGLVGAAAGLAGAH